MRHNQKIELSDIQVLLFAYCGRVFRESDKDIMHGSWKDLHAHAKYLENLNLVTVEICGDQEFAFRLTARGSAHLRTVARLPLPVQKWVTPEEGIE